MADDLPTIPEIVNALLVLNEQHSKAINDIRDQHNIRLRAEVQKKEGYAHLLERRDISIAGLQGALDSLAGTLEAIQQTAQGHQRDCVMMEPGEVYRMAKVNVGALRNSEIRKARARTLIEQTQDREQAPHQHEFTHLSSWPSGPDGECESLYRCGCGMQKTTSISQDEEPERDVDGEIEALRSQLSEARAQARNAIGREEWYANAVDRLRDKFGRDAVEPIVKAARLAHDFKRLTPEQQEKAKEDGYVPESAPEACPRCPHPLDDHAWQPFSKGGQPYCKLCPADGSEVHSLIPESAPEDGTALPTDGCTCSHPRHQHYDGVCQQCPRDHASHEFALAVL